MHNRYSRKIAQFLRKIDDIGHYQIWVHKGLPLKKISLKI